MRSIIRAAVNHPILAGGVLMLSHSVVLVVLTGLLFAPISPGMKGTLVRRVNHIMWLSALLICAGIGVWLTVVRRRSGQSAWPVCWLALIGPLQLIVQISALNAVMLLFAGGIHNVILFFCRPSSCGGMFFHAGASAAPVGILGGGLVGQLLARRKLRTGRWQHMAAIGSLMRKRPSLLARHPVLAAVVLMSPVLAYTSLLPLSDAVIILVVYALLSVATALAAACAIVMGHAENRVEPNSVVWPVGMAVLGALIGYTAIALGFRSLAHWSASMGIGFFYADDQSIAMARSVFLLTLIGTLVAVRFGVSAASSITRAHTTATDPFQ